MTPLASQLDEIPDLHHISYANDITLWCSSGSPGHAQDTLQRGLDLIGSFLTTTGVSPAPEKSELLLLNHSAYQRSHNALICLHLSGSPIPIVPQCKVLGFPLHAAKNVHALHHAVTTCHSVTHLLRRVVTRRSGLHEAHACRVAHALALNKFLYFVPYVSFTDTQLNTPETALLGLYKTALKLRITTSIAKLFATGLFHPLSFLFSFSTVTPSLPGFPLPVRVHLPLPADAATCGKCGTLVIHQSHYTGRMHPVERRKSAAGDGAMPSGAATALTDDELVQLCRERMREESGFAALVLQRAAEDEDAALGEQRIIPQAEAKSDVVAAGQVPAVVVG
ncbi:hypothetical protein HPB49_010097 [Dermacentor silvarum]|uniref:Uncharacterized protein n=1 Tax=Dermacentor silvarum TaxID=543639 RepID=A0ACB8CKC5_DERSI|nr:hypothetical protein HPB49_010097 [Dermacentor silvarum]